VRAWRLGQGMIVALGIAGLVLGTACVSGPRPPEGGAGALRGATSTADAAPEAGGKVEKPFAGSTAEATQLVSAAMETTRDGMASCVSAHRKRKNVAHARVEVHVGIDQDGNLLGATLAKGGQDEELSACVTRALQNAPFPRSRSGVISFTKVYEEFLR
jgi:hypothetical protein